MKKILLFSIGFMLGLNLFSQPGVKIFAYEQDNLPGTRPAGVIDENGNRVKKAAPKKNYFIYLSFKKTCTITPVEIYIRGKSFAVQRTILTKTPVEYTDNIIPNNPEKTILVPVTNNNVLEVPIAEPSPEQKKTANVQKLTAKNDVVVGYVWNKKKYYVVLKQLKKLTPRVNE